VEGTSDNNVRRPSFGRRSSGDASPAFDADNLQMELRRWKEQWRREVGREETALHRTEQEHFAAAEARAVEQAGQSIFRERTVGDVYGVPCTGRPDATTSVVSTGGERDGSNSAGVSGALARFRSRRPKVVAANDSGRDMLCSGGRFRLKGSTKARNHCLPTAVPMLNASLLCFSFTLLRPH
jgi:hypothetical protein